MTRPKPTPDVAAGRRGKNSGKSDHELHGAGYMRPANEPPETEGQGYMRPDEEPPEVHGPGWMRPEHERRVERGEAHDKP